MRLLLLQVRRGSLSRSYATGAVRMYRPEIVEASADAKVTNGPVASTGVAVFVTELGKNSNKCRVDSLPSASC